MQNFLINITCDHIVLHEQLKIVDLRKTEMRQSVLLVMLGRIDWIVADMLCCNLVRALFQDNEIERKLEFESRKMSSKVLVIITNLS